MAKDQFFVSVETKQSRLEEGEAKRAPLVIGLYDSLAEALDALKAEVNAAAADTSYRSDYYTDGLDDLSFVVKERFGDDMEKTRILAGGEGMTASDIQSEIAELEARQSVDIPA